MQSRQSRYVLKRRLSVLRKGGGKPSSTTRRIELGSIRAIQGRCLHRGMKILRVRVSCDKHSRHLRHAGKNLPEPPRTLMVTGNPAMAFWTTLCTRAPLPMCSLLLSKPHCPRRAATSSPGPNTGQKANGAGSEAEAFR